MTCHFFLFTRIIGFFKISHAYSAQMRSVKRPTKKTARWHNSRAYHRAVFGVGRARLGHFTDHICQNMPVKFGQKSDYWLKGKNNMDLHTGRYWPLTDFFYIHVFAASLCFVFFFSHFYGGQACCPDYLNCYFFIIAATPSFPRFFLSVQNSNLTLT